MYREGHARRARRVLGVLLCSALFFAHPAQSADGPSLLISPSGGSFAIGSTFDVNIGVNTGGKAINAFKVKIYFPADKLQVVSSSTGKSITGFWVQRPVYSNEGGTIELEGAIPSPGVNTDFGIISTITFRAKSLGAATIRLAHDSTLYLNDGHGTEISALFQDGLYQLILPPPQGPVVVSPTHPDQNRWYPANDVILRWAGDQAVQGYSYILNDTPLDVPDNIADAHVLETIYKQMADGVYYFHIKALRDGVWGGVTHYGIKIENGAPAKFKIDVSPGTRTSSKTVLFTFETTDPLSGMDHYEAKVLRLDAPKIPGSEKDTGLFFEVQNPFAFHAEDFGRYQFIVRAYNRAGNYTEESVKVAVVKPLFQFIADDGISFGSWFVMPWYLFWPLLLALILLLLYILRHMFRWHLHIEVHRIAHQERTHASTQRLTEFRKRFGGGLRSLVLLFTIASLLGLTTGARTAQAAIQVPPPVTNLISSNINNDEIFYIGGRAAGGSDSQVVLYLESLSTGETLSFTVPISATGDWFYTHPTFLQAGNYVLWTQLKIGDQVSPPSSQIQLTVSRKAIQLGASRISLETLYGIIILLLAIFMVVLGFGIWYYWKTGKRKHALLVEDMRHAQEALTTGFDTLKKDIIAELDMVHDLKHKKVTTTEQKQREEQLLKDLEEINRHIHGQMLDAERGV